MSNASLFGDESSPLGQDPAASPVHTQSLYRKYRPQSFDASELVGQEHVVRTLRNAILLGRVAHAYLFCGPHGTGKTTTARILAKAVNCLHPDVMQRPCNECLSCRAIATGATADVIEIDAASNRGIDDIRDLRERVKYAPTQLAVKFYIIDEAHQITGAAANAFLKTLEEPPAHTKFVLATTDPEELLPTIVSRCQRFDFRRVSAAAMTARLRTVATADAIAIDDEALATIVRHSTGSLRDALGMLDQLSVFVDRTGGESAPIGADDVLALLGVSRNQRIERLVAAIAARDAGEALGVVNQAVDAGEDPRQLNRQLVAYLRVLLHERAGGSQDADETAKGLAREFELARLMWLAKLFSETDFKIRHTSHGQLPLELAVVEAIIGEAATAPATVERAATPAQPVPSDRDLLAGPPATTLRDRLRRTPSPGPATGATIPAPEPAVAGSPPAAVDAVVVAGAPIEVGLLADLWPRIRADVKAVNRRFEALLASADPVGVNGNAVTIATPYEFHRNKLNEEETRRVIEDVLSRNLKRTITLTCVSRDEIAGVTGASAAANSRPGATRPPESSPAAVESDDEKRIRAAKNLFDAEEIES